MPTSAAEIETIIRIVVERLRGMAAAQTLEQSSHHTQLTVQPIAVQSNSPVGAITAPAAPPLATLRLEQKLITLEQLKNKLAGVQVLEVTARAIVTPAVLDELRDRRVKLHRTSAPQVHPTVEAANQTLIIAPALKRIQTPDALSRVESASLEGTLQAITEYLAIGGRRVIWSSPSSFAAMLSTKTSSGIQALQLFRLNDLAQAISQAKPNLLIVDDPQWPVAALINLARNWKRSQA